MCSLEPELCSEPLSPCPEGTGFGQVKVAPGLAGAVSCRDEVEEKVKSRFKDYVAEEQARAGFHQRGALDQVGDCALGGHLVAVPHGAPLERHFVPITAGIYSSPTMSPALGFVL